MADPLAEVRDYLDQHGDWLKPKSNGKPDWVLAPYLDHLSSSSLSMARRCAEQFRYRYILGRKERPGQAPVIGSAVHAGLHLNFDQKCETHEDLPLADVLDWYHDVGFDAIVDEEQQNSGQEVAWDVHAEQTEAQAIERAKTRGRVMLAAYHQDVSKRIQPVSSEKTFEHDFGLPVPLTGRIDVERAESTVDFKTGKRKASKPKEDWRIQAAVYIEARGKPLEFHSLTATESNNVSIVTPLESPAMLVEPTAGQRALLRDNVRMIAAEISLYMETLGPDRPWPTYGRFHTWACDYCGFRPICPAWEEER